MATTIKLKNGSGAPLAGDLVAGEPALDLTNKRLYTEDSGGTIIEVGTNPSTIDINAGTIDGTVIGGASAAAGTFTTFTSTGIDDNATSTAITIDSSQNVGIGTAAPSAKLSIKASSPGNLINTDDGTVLTYIADTTGNQLKYGTFNSYPVVFHTNNTERMRIDSSGNVGIGTTDTGNAGLSVSKANVSNNVYSRINGVATANEAGLQFADQNTLKWTIAKPGSSNDLIFYNHTGPSEAMRIDASGNLLVGTTTSIDGRVSINANAANSGCIGTSNNGLSTYYPAFFYHSGSLRGYIATTSSSTQYATSSDVRLKENIVDAPAGNIDDIRVRSFDWKSDGSHQTYGMVAQELIDVAPEAVLQGRNEDDVWGVDYSKLVPMMIKEIQDLKAEVAALKGA